MTLSRFISFVTTGTMAFSVASVSAMEMQNKKSGVMVGGAMMVQNLDIVSNAMNAKNVTTVVAAVKAAGLVDTLKSAGPFTVFAPTNTAFNQLPRGTVASLLMPESKDKLVSVLTYHVVSGRYTSKDLKDGMTLTTVNGATLKVKRRGMNIWINNSRVSIRDVISSNGVTHVINKVLLPPAKMTNDSPKQTGVMVGGALMVPNLDIVANAMNANNVTTVVAAVKAAGLVDTLKSKGPFTVFAPTNDAFNKLPAGTVDTLLKTENKATLTSILTYHVVSGRYTSKDLKDGMTLTTVQGQTLKVQMKDGKWWINDSMVVTADVISSNGVTFVVDTVLMPK